MDLERHLQRADEVSSRLVVRGDELVTRHEPRREEAERHILGVVVGGLQIDLIADLVAQGRAANNDVLIVPEPAERSEIMLPVLNSMVIAPLLAERFFTTLANFNRCKIS